MGAVLQVPSFKCDRPVPLSEEATRLLNLRTLKLLDESRIEGTSRLDVESFERRCVAEGRAIIEAWIAVFREAGARFSSDDAARLRQVLATTQHSGISAALEGLRRKAVLTGDDTGLVDISAHLKRMGDQALSVLDRDVEIWLAEESLRKERAMPVEKPVVPQAWDLFISHASEDKLSVVRPLVARLEAAGLAVWFDEQTLTLGDSLPRKIDEGLAKCRFGVVVLSPAFFKKEWPRRELDGLAIRETTTGGQKVILPVYYQVSAGEVSNYSPTLGSKLGVKWSDGIDKVVQEILSVVQDATSGSPLSVAAVPSLAPEVQRERSRMLIERQEELIRRLWESLQGAIGHVTSLTSLAQTHPDVSRLEASVLERLLVGRGFSDKDRALVVNSDPQDRFQTFLNIDNDLRYRAAALEGLKFNNLLVLNRPFVAPVVWDAFRQANLKLRHSLISLEVWTQSRNEDLRRAAAEEADEAGVIAADVVVPAIQKHLGLNASG